jgi:hypothetical protein
MIIPKKLNREKLYKYGERSENILYEIIKQYRDDAILTDRYNHFDYIIETDNKIILIELKTRTHLKDTFGTTFLPLSKITYYNKYKKQNANKKCYLLVVFGFPTEFNKYDISNNPYDSDKNINIIVDDLKPIEYYLNVIKEY